MKAVVLSGGKSTRMGTDKGLLKHDSKCWAELAFNKLTSLRLPVIISINSKQYDSYSSIFPASVLVEDNESLNIGGPLKGILSAHLENTDEDLLVFACDMLSIQIEVFEHLLATWFSSSKHAEAIVFKDEDGVEPLVAIYSATGLKKINSLYKQGQLRKHSMHYILELLSTEYLHIPEDWKGYFRNFNTPAEL